MKHESEPVEERRFTAPSGFADANTEIIEKPVVANESDESENPALENPEKEKREPIDLDKAFGATVAGSISPEMIDRIHGSPKLHAMALKMMRDGTGDIVEQNPHLMNKLRVAFGIPVGETSESGDDDSAPVVDSNLSERLSARGLTSFANFFARRQEKREQRRAKIEQKIREKNPDISDEELKEKADRRQRFRVGRNVLVTGAVAVGGYILFNEVADHFGWFGHGGGNGGSGGSGAQTGELPKPGQGQDSLGGMQLDRYFDMPDTSKMADKLHHANDYSPGNAALSALDKQGAVNNLRDMFRGNSHITAMWASQLHIPGAPEMPPLDVLQHNNAAVIEYNTKINEWADFLQANPKVRADVTDQMVKALDGGTLGNKVTLEPGYLSEGSNNTAGALIYGSKPGGVFIDPEVGYRNVEAVEWHVNGQTVLVETGCNQIAFQPPHTVHAPVVESTPVAQHVPVHHNTPTPPHHDTPPVTPPHNTPPTDTPPTDTPPTDTPPTPTPPDDHKGMERNNGINILPPGDFEATPAPVQTEVSTPAPNGGTITEHINTPIFGEAGGHQAGADATPNIPGPVGSSGQQSPESGSITSP